MKNIESIMKESRQIFICEQRKKINEMMICLMKYRLKTNSNQWEELRRYFHSLNGTCAVLQLEKLSEIGKTYEEFMDVLPDDEKETNNTFSYLLNGLALASEEVEDISKKQLTLINSGKIEDRRSGSNEVYTNMTSSGTMLIVDDDIALLNQLENVFSEEGYKVLVSENPQKVAEMIYEEKIDIIVLDVMMPKLDGFELLTILKNEKPEIPVIFLSAKTITKAKVQALDHGADDYITKPFEMSEVVARVNRVLKREADYNTNILLDELTGAYTKKHFRQKIEDAKKMILVDDKPFTVAFIDIDRFKQVNDEYGHIRGDYILKRFTEIFIKNLRTSDQIYRFGGDEFLILFPKARVEDASMVLKRIKGKIENETFIENEGQPISVSFSAGITAIESPEQTIDDILQKADHALYESKRSGRNTITIYNSKINNVAEEVSWETNQLS